MSLAYTPEQIAQIIQGDLITHEFRKPITELIYDSRRIIFPEASAFFALKTNKNDGHKFIRHAYHLGVRTFVIDDEIESNFLLSDVSIIEVDNVLEALQELAEYHRTLFNIPIIGLTGSNGKTVVKEWLFTLLNPEFNLVRSPKSFNSQIGVPLSVWQIDRDSQMGIFEVGISKSGEMSNLEKLVKPNIGIFTNIGDAHDIGFTSRPEKIREKLQLFKDSSKLLYSVDYDDLHDIIKEYDFADEEIELKTWSFNPSKVVNLSIYDIQSQENEEGKSLLFARYKGKELVLEVPFNDKAYLENCAICWLLLLEMGYEQKTIQERISKLHQINMRIEQKSGLNNTIIINDSYSLDLSSLKIALNFLDSHQSYPRKTVFLSSFQESPRNAEQKYKDMAKIIKTFKLSRLILVGEEISKYADFFKADDVLAYSSTPELIDEISSLTFDSETVLLKGARRFEFERIERFLSDRLHQTQLEINLDAVKKNYGHFKSLIKPEVKIMAMVKAFSYGSGALELANLMQYENASYLGVAYADEGVHLRRHGCVLPIMVMNPERGSFNSIIEHDLEPVFYSLREMELFITFLKHMSYGGKLSIHLEINSGMNRLGFDPELCFELAQRLVAEKDLLNVRSIFSHFNASENPAALKHSREQIDRFERAYDLLATALGYKPIKHICNTTGIINFPEQHYDMVRLGIGMYGIDPSGVHSEHLEPALLLRSVVSQTRTVQKGEYISYGIEKAIEEPKQIATIALGYADGLRRSFGNGHASFLIGSHLVHTIGAICMDMCMVDITGLNITEGEEAIFFGKELTIESQCERIGIIPYELLTSISSRVKRVYTKEEA